MDKATVYLVPSLERRSGRSIRVDNIIPPDGELSLHSSFATRDAGRRGRPAAGIHHRRAARREPDGRDGIYLYFERSDSPLPNDRFPQLRGYESPV